MRGPLLFLTGAAYPNNRACNSMAEYLSFKQGVGGSSPPGRTGPTLIYTGNPTPTPRTLTIEIKR